MPRSAHNLAGRKIGRLRVIDRAANGSDGRPRWNCICVCGKRCTVRGGALRAGMTTSCGCVRKESARKHMQAMRSGARYAAADSMAETFAADPRALLRRLGIA